MDMTTQTILRRQNTAIWLVVGLLVVNTLILIGNRVQADGDAVQKVQISGPVEVQFAGTTANTKPLSVSIAEFPTKPLNVKEAK